jgi:hypothetical protein
MVASWLTDSAETPYFDMNSSKSQGRPGMLWDFFFFACVHSATLHHFRSFTHYSSAPHHRRFVMSITNGSGGVGFMSLVMGGASPPVQKPLFRTGSDDYFPTKKIYSDINITTFV